ncbi:hypothetical protein WN944_010725 [Citrus x changshan-huyou]|uniref:Alpha-L-arabinofuranosidase 1 catalytic domain-containing protein n=1 Tax=Citrus x changshan-huyou TaxID=2935761 RepID=A0AAP0MUP3_9ROSI
MAELPLIRCKNNGVRPAMMADTVTRWLPSGIENQCPDLLFPHIPEPHTLSPGSVQSEWAFLPPLTSATFGSSIGGPEENRLEALVMFGCIGQMMDLEALDGIEFARGDPNSTWGSTLTATGHPDPFDFRYVAIGNEDCGRKNYRGLHTTPQQPENMEYDYYVLRYMKDIIAYLSLLMNDVGRKTWEFYSVFAKNGNLSTRI